MINDDMERTMQFILEQQAQFMANIQILQEQRVRDTERLARVERAFVQLTDLALSANERMNEHDARMDGHDTRLARIEEAVVMVEGAFVQLTELAVSANERMNTHDSRLARVEEAVVMLTRLVGGRDGE
jgi:chromosome segregation ATPase